MWSNVVEETGEPGENHRTWTGDHYPATCLDTDSNPDRRGDKRVRYPLRYPGPRGMIGRFYKKDHYTLLHTKYEGSGPCGFGEEDFFMFCPITPQGRGLYRPQGHSW